jgi:putative membrane protein
VTELFDPGLQPERTALAWRRTALAILASSLVAARILAELFGPWAALLGLLGVALAAWLLASVHGRYRRHHESLTGSAEPGRVAGGMLIFATSAFVFAAGAVTIVIVLVLALGQPTPAPF